jgi:hypothetical protein
MLAGSMHGRIPESSSAPSSRQSSIPFVATCVVLVASATILITLAGTMAAREKKLDASRGSRFEGTRISRVRPADDARDVLPDASVAVDLAFPRPAVPGMGIDPKTLAEGARLFDADGKRIDAHANTSGAGDSLVLTPAQLLSPGMTYTFSTTPILADENGKPVPPFKSHFTVSRDVRQTQIDVAFEHIRLAIESGSAFTCVVVGPDHRLYAATYDGRIMQFELAPDGTPTLLRAIDTIVKHEGGPRTVIGLVFDPRDEGKLWVTHGAMTPFVNGMVKGSKDWTGKLAVLEGADFSNCRDAIVGLPRAFKDHLTFQPAFGPDGAIYFGQGSNTSVGAPDAKWGMRPEHMLTAAILRFDPTKRANEWPIDVQTEDGKKYDPRADGAPLTLYATGVRSAYDVLWHSNGHLYTGVNGAASGGATPARPSRDGVPSVAAIDPLDFTCDDVLLDVRPGGYYGAPNPSRGELILNGGNPTDAEDPYEVPAYPVGTIPEPTWLKPAFDFGKSASPNGLIEYHAPAGFGAAIDRAILVTRYSAGDDIVALQLDADGRVKAQITGIEGFGGFRDPLDLSQDLTTGNIYVAEFGGQRITLLRPRRGASSEVYVRPAN